LNSDTVKFVNTLEEFASDSEKAYVWILIELSNKNIFNVFEEITLTPAIMFHYSPRSLMKRHGQEIKEILGKLCKIEYKVESKFLKAYEERENESGDYYENESQEQPHMITHSPVLRRSSEMLLRKLDTYESTRHKSSADSPLIHPVTSGSLENTRTSSLFKSASSVKGRLEIPDKKKDSLEWYKNQLDMPRFEENDENVNVNINVEEGKEAAKDFLIEDEMQRSSTPEWKPRRLVIFFNFFFLTYFSNAF